MKQIKRFPLTTAEKRRYVMSTDKDYEILKKVKCLEKLKLRKEEKILIQLIKTQLELEWRKYLLKTLNNILKRYAKSTK